jgi:hypothetical protein
MEEERERSPGEMKKRGAREGEDDVLPEGEATTRQRRQSRGPGKGEGDGKEVDSAHGCEGG